VSDRLTVIRSLTQQIEQAIAPLLANLQRIALVDFPNHSNVGDSAIWLGELSCLRALGAAELCYTCDLRTYDPRQLGRRLGNGTILIHGGGNLGDLWPAHQLFRERILSDFPGNPVIQLPQSIRFREPAALKRAARIFDAHPNFTLLIREQQSLEIARNELRTASVLCPDLAFHLGAQERRIAASISVVWLARTDHEAAHDSLPADAPGLVADWLEETPTMLQTLNHWLTRTSWRARVLRDVLSATYEPLARQRWQRGCDLLSRGHIVVTDRLHAHILCVLLNIPHVLFDNNYGKLSSFYRTWTSHCDLVQWVDSPHSVKGMINSDSTLPKA
jgi:exopolysaccharide biosynthesis predicted pyruvyltransferase EpsI